MSAARFPSGDHVVAVPAVLLAGVLGLVVVEAGSLAPSVGPSAAPPAQVAVDSSSPAIPTLPPDHPAMTVAATVEQPTTVATVADVDELPKEGDEPLPSQSQPPPAQPQPTAIRPTPTWTAEQMQESLLRVPEIFLQDPAYPQVAPTGRATRTYQPVLHVIDARPDLQGLPVRRGPDLRLSRTDADALRDTSVLLRKAVSDLAGQRTANRRLTIHPEVLAARPDMVARMLLQMLQTEPVPLRKVLVHQLNAIQHPNATRALAQRAVYEPVAELRRMAVDALSNRPAGEYLASLLDALASRWPPAADFAAEALAKLAPADAVPELIHRLDGPAGPVTDGPAVYDLVRVNHARNCLLCHAQSTSSRDGIRVAVPSPSRPLPSPFSLATYQGGGRGGSSVPSDTVFARPDTTYLKQDFSWQLPVANPGPWPEMQRYDFIVRTRPASPGESAPAGADSPQRQAVLRALRALTGKDFGERAADWRAGLLSAAQ